MKAVKTVRTKKAKSVRSGVSSKPLAALRVRLAELEQKIARLELRDEALDHSIEELAAAWVAESK